MKRKWCFLVMLCFSICVSACATQRNITLTSSFDAVEANKLLAPGKNTIEVNAFLRKKSGDIVTCAGFEVVLSPATEMAQERVTAIYGSPQGGFSNYYANQNIKITNDDPAYYAARKHTVCNSDGKAVFKNVADGEFYIAAIVAWEVPTGMYATTTEGGVLARRVSVKGGETKEVVLTY